jgi:pyridoxal phosphate enzyme (YggS family)
MAVVEAAYRKIMGECRTRHVALVAVSKTKPVEDILALYNMGHRDFGENYVQELVEKQARLPEDIRWHFIGHLQSNKVKYIAPFVHMIHGIDSLKLLQEVNKQGARKSRKINCLLQLYVASEETKFGLDEAELESLLEEYSAADEMEFVRICGLMAMASFTDNQDTIKKEFSTVSRVFESCKDKYFYHDEYFREISMGMSSDYPLAIAEGSTMIRVGSLIFGERKPAP